MYYKFDVKLKNNYFFLSSFYWLSILFGIYAMALWKTFKFVVSKIIL